MCPEKGKFIPSPRISQRFVCKILRIFDHFVCIVTANIPRVENDSGFVFYIDVFPEVNGSHSVFLRLLVGKGHDSINVGAICTCR